MVRRTALGPDRGVYDLTNAPAHFYKAERERDRFQAAQTTQEKVDHFLNFCVSLTAAFDYFSMDAKAGWGKLHGRANVDEALKTFLAAEPLTLVREVANCMKHGRQDDLRLLKKAELAVREDSVGVVENNVDLTSPDLRHHFSADLMHVNMGAGAATVTSETVNVQLVNGRTVSAWKVMHQSLQVLREIFDITYRKGP